MRPPVVKPAPVHDRHKVEYRGYAGTIQWYVCAQKTYVKKIGNHHLSAHEQVAARYVHTHARIHTREERRSDGDHCTGNAEVHVDNGKELAGPKALVVPKTGQLLVKKGEGGRIGRGRSEKDGDLASPEDV